MILHDDITSFKNEKFDEGNLIIVSKMEGIHSRLSDFPFICGFHVTRACLRDFISNYFTIWYFAFNCQWIKHQNFLIFYSSSYQS